MTGWLTRRALLGTVALSGASLLTSRFVTQAVAQGRQNGPAEVPVDELMKQPELPDLSVGSAEAKVTIVEYASMTCPHCAHFHAAVLPELKTKYVDTGKVRLIFREFPLDNLAAAGSMLARCAGGEKSFELIGALFKRQDEWLVRGNPVPKLFDVAKSAGFTQETFDKCLTDQKLLDNITAIRTRAAEKFGVNSTPTFFINGKRFAGAPTPGEFDKVIEPLLKS